MIPLTIAGALVGELFSSGNAIVSASGPGSGINVISVIFVTAAPLALAAAGSMAAIFMSGRRR